MLNPNHPFVGRRHSDITEDELQYITSEEYEEYIAWGIHITLRHMILEGMVESFVCPESGETLYRLTPEQMAMHS